MSSLRMDGNDLCADGTELDICCDANCLAGNLLAPSHLINPLLTGSGWGNVFKSYLGAPRLINGGRALDDGLTPGQFDEVAPTGWFPTGIALDVVTSASKRLSQSPSGQATTITTITVPSQRLRYRYVEPGEDVISRWGPPLQEWTALSGANAIVPPGTTTGTPTGQWYRDAEQVTYRRTHQVGNQSPTIEDILLDPGVALVNVFLPQDNARRRFFPGNVQSLEYAPWLRRHGLAAFPGISNLPARPRIDPFGTYAEGRDICRHYLEGGTLMLSRVSTVRNTVTDSTHTATVNWADSGSAEADGTYETRDLDTGILEQIDAVAEDISWQIEYIEGCRTPPTQSPLAFQRIARPCTGPFGMYQPYPQPAAGFVYEVDGVGYDVFEAENIENPLAETSFFPVADGEWRLQPCNPPVATGGGPTQDQLEWLHGIRTNPQVQRAGDCGCGN